MTCMYLFSSTTPVDNIDSPFILCEHYLIYIKNISGEHIQRWFPPPLSSRATDQAASTGLHYSNTTLDVRAEFQSLTLRVPSHRNAVLYLRYYWNAG